MAIHPILPTAVLLLSITCLPACGQANDDSSVASLTPEMLGVAREIGTGDYAYETVDHLSHRFGSLDDGKGNRYMVLAGSKAAHETAIWIRQEMERIGLADVSMESYPIHAYELNGSSLSITASGETFATTAMAQTPPTPKGGITSELIDVGNGTRAEYEGKDVTGKIVLLSFSWEKQFYFNATMYEAKLRGAAGIIYDFLGQQIIPDSLYSYPLSPFKDQTIPALNISHNSMADLRAKLETGSLKVNMELDAVDAFDGIDHNVIGYIHGKKYPDELIIIGDHFDHYFYGALDCGTCVGSVLGLAKAFVDSGYQPDRTLVFVAHGAEENGWHTPWGPYINGAWNLIANQHPDWAGRTVAFFGWDWSGDINSTSINANTYTNEVHSFLESIKQPIDAYFTKHAPWSAYYEPATIPEDGGLSHQGWDALAYSNRGVPVFDLSASGTKPELPSAYHTQFDDLSRISGEAMALGMVATGIAAITLDRTDITPYDFATWTTRLETLLGTDQAELLTHGVDITKTLTTIDSVGQTAKALHGLVTSDPGRLSEAIIQTNALQRHAAVSILPHMYYSAGDFPYQSQWRHSQYLRDASALKSAITALDNGDSETAHTFLMQVASAFYGSNVSYEVHKAWIDFVPEALFSDDIYGPRIPKYTDVWLEAEALGTKIQNGDSDFSNEISSLSAKYGVVRQHLESAIQEMTSAIADAETPLQQAKILLQ